jgi:hypothetical protein
MLCWVYLFYRTSVGAEIDLVLETAPNERWTIEIKRSLGDPKPSNRWLPLRCDTRARKFSLRDVGGKDLFSEETRTSQKWAHTVLSEEREPADVSNVTVRCTKIRRLRAGDRDCGQRALGL